VLTAHSHAGIAERVVAGVNVELLKWVGAALMLYEHAWRFGVGTFPGHVYFAGRVVFPAFVIALAASLRHARQETLTATWRRMAMWAAAAAAGSMIARGTPSNVLMTFAAGTFLYCVWAGFARVRWAAVLLTAWLAFGVEFGAYGVAAVFFALNAARTRNAAGAAVSATAAFIALALAQSNATIGAVGVIVACGIATIQLELPRIRRLFYWVYVAQWPLIALIKAVL
jgi:hypothetical protein